MDWIDVDQSRVWLCYDYAEAVQIREEMMGGPDESQRGSKCERAQSHSSMHRDAHELIHKLMSVPRLGVGSWGQVTSRRRGSSGRRSGTRWRGCRDVVSRDL